MSGVIVNNVARASGTIAATPGGLDWSAAVVTASTVTVEAGRGYFINTSSNACTVTLPSSAEAGDQIIIADYARSWATNAVTLDSNGLNFQGSPDTYTVEYSTVGQSLNIVYSDSTKGWLPVSDDAVADVPLAPPTQRAIFALGTAAGGKTAVSNLVNSSGVIASDTAAVGSVRSGGGGASYGGDKAIIGFGEGASDWSAVTNLVNNSGVIASDTAAVSGATARYCTACSFGADRALFGFGYGWDGSANVDWSVTNLVSTSGVVSSNTTGVGTARRYPGSVRYGPLSNGKAIVYGGAPGGSNTNTSNLISAAGVVASDTTGVGTARQYPVGVPFGGDQAIFAYGYTSSVTNVANKVSTAGVISSDITGVGTSRYGANGAPYGGDKGVIAYGTTGSVSSLKNLVSNSGTVGSDVTGVGTARNGVVAAGYSQSA